MLKTLHGKLSLVLLGLLCLTGLLYLALTLVTTQMYFQEVNQKVNRRLAADLTTHLAARGLLRPANQGRAQAEIKELMAINPSVEVYLLDARGGIQTYSVAPDTVKRRGVSLAPIRLFLSGAAPLPILGDDPRDPRGRKVFSAAAFSSEGQTGYVYVILGGEGYDATARLPERSAILRSSFATVVVILLFVLAAGLLFFRLLTRRLRWLTASMETFRDQDYHDPETVLSARLFTPWPGITPPRDEIDRLGLVHLQMTNRIRGQILALAQADTHRREMISNVSHDLRTPLAALHGYLETLLMKEGSLTPEEQRGYLQVALRHSERLAKLIGELFDLAQLDSGEMRLNPETFSLGELVQDVVQQHDLAARQKGLRLQALLPDDLPFVSADIALVERVLGNLLENALRYTPEGGAVTIRLALQVGKIEVRVADTGSGIRPEDLPHIFERFYRVPRQSEKPGCVGLGLAIVKRILELHGSAIQVESAPDQGTAFTFHLPVHAGL